ANDFLPIGLIDRSLTGTMVRGLRVYSSDEIPNLSLNTLIVAASTSGPEIISSLSNYTTEIAIFPLHDLTDPIWRVWLGDF
ncbi:MAG: hypothetical protein H7842_14990, partial [Gammaproteobacteria bacterium SHHR-1]